MQKEPQDTKHEMEDWEFNFCEGSLSASTEIEKTAEECKLFRPPTIIFGHNYCHIVHNTKDFRMIFNAKEALRFINYEHRKNCYYSATEQPKENGISYLPPKLQIKHA